MMTFSHICVGALVAVSTQMNGCNEEKATGKKDSKIVDEVATDEVQAVLALIKDDLDKYKSEHTTYTRHPNVLGFDRSGHDAIGWGTGAYAGHATHGTHGTLGSTRRSNNGDNCDEWFPADSFETGCAYLPATSFESGQRYTVHTTFD